MADIQLVSAPTDEGRIPLYEDGAFAPLGLIWLGSHLKDRGYDIEIIDGQHTNLDSIKSKIEAPLVGVNFNVFSSNSLEKIVQTAKSRGSTVVVGGQAATPLSRELLTNPNIDYVVKYDGEEALRLLAEGRGIRSIPNLVYRSEESIIENPTQLTDLTKLPAVTWDLPGIDINNYWKRFQEVLKSVKTHHTHKRPLSSFTKKGCPMRQNDKGCSFCSRTDTRLRSKTPEQVYNEFQYLVSLGTDRIEEFSDSWLYDRKWLKKLTNLVDTNGHWGVPVRVYADTRHFNPEIIELCKKIGIDSVILGIESGNEVILRQNGKPNTTKQILYCADLLGKSGIRASPSYVVGLIGESERTIDDTFRIADQIKAMCEIEMSYFSIMTPFPGSKAWEMLRTDPEMRDKHSGYKLDAEELQRDFIERYTHLGSEGFDYLSRRLDERLKSNGIAQRDY